MRAPELIIKRPLLTEKGTLLKETGGNRRRPRSGDRQVAAPLRGREGRQQGRDSPRRREALERRRRLGPHVDRARQGEAHGPLHRQRFELEEGRRDDRGRPEHRVLRGRRRSHGSSYTQRHHAGLAATASGRTSPSSRRATSPRSRSPAPISRTGGRNHYGRITSRFRGGGHKQRYRIIDFRRDKIGVPAKVATVEYDPNRTARIALLHYADGEKRYILAPDGLKVGDTVLVVAQRRHQAGQHPAAALHPARHDDPQHRAQDHGQGAQLVPLGGRRARSSWRRTATTRQVRLPSGEIRKVHLDCRATIGQVVEHRARAASRRQGRPHALARPSPAQPRRHDEPGRSPDGRRRRPYVRWSSPVLAVGSALEGSQDAQQQAHRRHDRQAPRQEG